MSYEGAMIGGYLLPKNEFISLMSELLQSNENIINTYLNQTLKYIQQGLIKNAYSSWTKFQTEILKNPKVSLLAILNFRSSTNQIWSFMDDEEYAISNQIGALNIQSVDQGLKREYNSAILTKHLSNLFRTIAEKMEEDEINYLYGLNKAEIYKQLNPIKYGDQLYTYKNVVYGNTVGRFYNGKVADAFLNHIGAIHWEYLNNFSQTGNLINGDHLLKTSVKTEERAIHNLNFIKLLMASTNRTPWFTGGDLIVTDNRGAVVANIQLKTSGSEGSWIGNIRTKALENQIKKILLAIKQGSQIASEAFYETLKTSSASEQLGDKVIEEAYSLAKNILKLN